jgi:predicted dehydrogenase
MRIAIIGYGYWGPNLVRNFSATEGAQLKLVIDGREERLQLVRKNYPQIDTSKDVELLRFLLISNLQKKHC